MARGIIIVFLYPLEWLVKSDYKELGAFIPTVADARSLLAAEELALLTDQIIQVCVFVLRRQQLGWRFGLRSLDLESNADGYRYQLGGDALVRCIVITRFNIKPIRRIGDSNGVPNCDTAPHYCRTRPCQGLIAGDRSR